jgi:hypothetical protein
MSGRAAPVRAKGGMASTPRGQDLYLLFCMCNYLCIYVASEGVSLKADFSLLFLAISVRWPRLCIYDAYLLGF